ncbi:ankyrin repeat-containing domain protein [Dactylonectria estremocensis]|uniref:Ankyrin repeat-containing domain protein n=1 Tax=Dactylonectria estremocensis TaxID=1079267 RepID=A0A9P9E928_9HYPO|nr:ankyrin repeat-containing domain protein [Dactylonectria estremocensis]
MIYVMNSLDCFIRTFTFSSFRPYIHNLPLLATTVNFPTSFHAILSSAQDVGGAPACAAPVTGARDIQQIQSPGRETLGCGQRQNRSIQTSSLSTLSGAGSFSEAEFRLAGVAARLDSLYKLAARIRSPRNRPPRLTKDLYKHIPENQRAEYIRNQEHIETTRVAYVQRQQLGRDMTDIPPPPMPTEPQKTVVKPQAPTTVAQPVPPISLATSATKIDVDTPGLDDPNGRGFGLPLAPVHLAESTYFSCPYCGILCLARYLSQDQWRVWHCHVHEEEFETQPDYMQHLREKPLEHAPEDSSAEMVAAVVGASSKPHRDCPFCPTEFSDVATMHRHALDGGSDNERNDERLLRAVVKGDEAAVQSLLAQGANIHVKNNYKQTPLHVAASTGHKDIVRVLLDLGASIEAKDHEELTPLHTAPAKGNEQIVQLLLERGADPEAVDDDDETPLILAAELGQDAIAQLLLGRGADTEAVGGMFIKETPLSHAARRGHESIFVLDQGVYLEQWDGNAKTPLLLAAEHGREGVVRLLLDRGADMEAVDDRRRTPLSWAAGEGHEAVTQLLLYQGAAIAAIDLYGMTPLFQPASEGHVAVVKSPLDWGGIEAEVENSKKSLLCAIQRGHCTIVQLLLDRGANVDGEDNSSITPLSYAVMSSNERIIQLLLDRSAEKETTAYSHGTDLIDNGADTEIQDGDMQRLLHIAAKHGHEAVVQMLLNNGTAIEVQDNQRQRPMHMAAQQGHADVVRLLLSSGAFIEEIGASCAKSPFHLASEHGHEIVSRQLLDHGAGAEVVDDSGRTPLLCAAAEGHVAVVQLLLDRGAHLEAHDLSGRKSLSLAYVGGHRAVV